MADWRSFFLELAAGGEVGTGCRKRQHLAGTASFRSCKNFFDYGRKSGFGVHRLRGKAKWAGFTI